MFRKNESGQAIVIIALVLVVLLGFAALAIDAGNIYTEKRQAQNAADAAALAGARQIALECANGTRSQAKVSAAIQEMLKINNPGASGVGYYLFNDATAAPTNCAVGGCSGDVVCGCNGYRGVEVQVVGQTSSFLAGLIGRDLLTAKATARARYGPIQSINTGVYPITLPYSEFQIGTQVQVRVTKGSTPGNFGWLRWPEQNGGEPALATSLTPPGNSYLYENPGVPDSKKWTGADPNDHALAVGKWVHGRTGNVAAVTPEIDYLIDNGTTIIIPLYDGYVEQGNDAGFKIAAFGAFQLRCNNLKGQPSGDCVTTWDPSDKGLEGIFLGFLSPSGTLSNSCANDTALWTVKMVTQ